MLDVARWLAERGLGHHAEAFAENGIAGDVLCDLTDPDLRELGLNLGDRKRLLKAMAALSAGSAAARTDTAEPTPRPAVPREAERRQLTVLFVDVLGSTELAARLDPEDMGDVIRAYQRCCTEAVERWDGHVAKYMGDGVLAYFGWPQAHEDEAERAVRAGLAIIEALARLETPSSAPLAARIGIATGLVMVGELIGEGAAQERIVVGETPNLAARLQALAAPGSVVISQATRRLVGGLFALSDLGPQRLKGFGEPLAAWRVEGESHVEGRFDALHGERLTPLVGREHELGILLERWAWAKHGDGQVVLLAGEPGIGKSRLIRALRERLGDEMYAPLSHYCSPYHTNSALHPVIGLLEREARLDRDQPPLEQLARIEALVGRSSDGLDVPLLAALLGVPTGDRYPPLTLTPDTQKRRTLQALVDQLAGLAAQQPVLSLYEDVHWIDPSTLELLTLVIERIRQLPVLLLITFRPQFQPPWTGQAHVTTLTMNRLGRRQGADLVARVTGDKSLPAEIVDQIVARTDGVPLFIEELTKTVLDSGLLADAGDRYELSGLLPPLAIPTTLHDSLMARLDRLAPVKEVAQIGAVIGREFSHELLAAVADRPEDELRAALDQLVASELVFRRGAPPDATYSFKHALVQDAAYQSLLRSRRQQLHGRIARVLEERFLDAGDTQPEVLAHHCTEAGLSEKAVEYWYQAGRLASERAALPEAIGHFGKALELLGTFREPSARMQREIDLQIALGGTLIAAKGHAAPETGRAYARAGQLCRELGDLGRLLPLLFGQWVFHMARAEHAAAQEIAAEALRSAERDGDAAGLVVGHRAAGIGSLWRGDLVEARGHLEQELALYDPERHRSLASVYAYDPRLAGLAGLAFALFQLGYPEQAVARCREAVDDAERLSHPAGLAYALHHACMLDQVRRDGPGVRERAAALVALSAEHGFALWQAAGIALDGWALAEGGRAVEGIARIEDGLGKYRATGAGLFVPYFLALLGTTRGTAGEGAEGQRLLAEALDAGRASGERWFEAELYRVKGELSLAGGDRDTAEACFRSAIAVAREQSARLWELRATTSLARLRVDRGNRAEASSLLAPVYDWFTEGFDSPDLRDAKALLDELT